MTDQSYNEIMRAIGNLEGTVTKGFESVDKNFTGVNKLLEKYDTDIDKLQEDSAQMKGKAAMIGGIIGGVISIFWSLLKDKIKIL